MRDIGGPLVRLVPEQIVAVAIGGLETCCVPGPAAKQTQLDLRCIRACVTAWRVRGLECPARRIRDGVSSTRLLNVSVAPSDVKPSRKPAPLASHCTSAGCGVAGQHYSNFITNASELLSPKRPAT